jgi:hypothetical protein
LAITPPFCAAKKVRICTGANSTLQLTGRREWMTTWDEDFPARERTAQGEEMLQPEEVASMLRFA